MANGLSKQEEAIKAVRAIQQAVKLWSSGQTTHESAMAHVAEIVRPIKV